MVHSSHTPEARARNHMPASHLASALLVMGMVLVAAPAHAQLDAGRLQPGNLPASFLAALAAPPRLQDDGGALPRWLPYVDNRAAQSYVLSRGGITPAQRTTWEAQMRDMLTALKTAPVLSRALGVDYELSSSMMLVADEFFGLGGVRSAALGGSLNIGAFRHADVVTTADGRLRTAPGAHTAHFLMSVNLIPAIPPGPWMRDDAGSFFPRRVDGTFDGLPIHGSALVLTRENRSPYRPVSWERAISAFLASHLKDTQSAGSAREMLARMNAAERQQQAHVCSEMQRWSLEHCFVTADTRHAVPLVSVDTAFFDSRLPRTTIQIVTVEALNNATKGSEPGSPNSPFAIHLALVQQTNWKAFRDRFVR